MDGQIHRRYETYHAPEDDSAHTDWAGTLGRRLRVVSQVLGLFLILVGAYFGIQVFLSVWRLLRSPADLEPALVGIMELLQMQHLAVPVGEEKVAVGRPVATGVLLLVHIVCAWIALAVLAAGGRLINGLVNERREFLAAMRAFLVTVREEGVTHKPKDAG
jgi:hypothetical protein